MAIVIMIANYVFFLLNNGLEFRTKRPIKEFQIKNISRSLKNEYELKTLF